VRVLSFERLYPLRDPDGTLGARETFAARLRERYAAALEKLLDRAVHLPREGALAAAAAQDGTGEPGDGAAVPDLVADRMHGGTGAPANGADYLEASVAGAIHQVQQDPDFLEKMKRGIPWRGVMERLKQALPVEIDAPDRERLAYQSVRRFLEATFGPEGKSWHTEHRPSKARSGDTTTWIVLGPAQGEEAGQL
jgi:hypothetical protein